MQILKSHYSVSKSTYVARQGIEASGFQSKASSRFWGIFCCDIPQMPLRQITKILLVLQMIEHIIDNWTKIVLEETNKIDLHIDAK